MEATEKIPGFAKARISAERNARRRKQPEIVLYEIYEEIESEYKSYIDLEMKYEKQVLQQNVEMKSVFDCVISLNKTVILASDMYLPSKFIDNVLKLKGFDGYHKLFVSGEHRTSKGTGGLFKVILKDLGIEPCDLLHIGDNDKSDIRIPKNIGINVIKYENITERYLRSHKKERVYYRLRRNYERSVIVGIDALFRYNTHKKNDNFWYNFGYRYGGPVNTAFASFINENAEKDSVLFFIARDGYNAQKAYNILFGKIENHYIYAARRFNILFGINGRDYPGYEEDIIDYFSDHPEVRELSGTPHEILIENPELFERLMEKELTKYKSYIDCYTKHGNSIYVVDASTRKFSSQKLIDEVTNKSVKGLYYVLLRNKSDDNAKGFCDNYRSFFELTAIDVPEFLMSSDEKPIVSIDDSGYPVYDSNSNEWFRTDVMPKMTAGMTDYFETVKSVFGDFIPVINHDSVNRWILNLSRFMSKEEQEYFDTLNWTSDPTHSEYHKLFFSLSDVPRFILNKVKDGYESIMSRIK
ncbi:MAG: hypothetical protein WC201_02630 [Bacilli bacterium]|jgi:HAD superfamily hydrolase (TIGR01549 family)